MEGFGNDLWAGKETERVSMCIKCILFGGNDQKAPFEMSAKMGMGKGQVSSGQQGLLQNFSFHFRIKMKEMKRSMKWIERWTDSYRHTCGVSTENTRVLHLFACNCTNLSNCSDTRKQLLGLLLWSFFMPHNNHNMDLKTNTQAKLSFFIKQMCLQGKHSFQVFITICSSVS